MEKGYIWNNYFIYKDEIGVGSFSKVYKAVNTNTKKLVAIKKISKSRLSELLIKKFINEIHIIQSLEHPNIIKLIDYSINEKYIIIILEYCNNGSLTNLIKKKLNENEIRPIMYQLISGMNYLNAKGIFHRDIKPDNILLSDTNVKIIDFGFSIQNDTDNYLYSTVCGTPMYMSPELIMGKKYTNKSDLWSLGVIAYELYHNRNPFFGSKNIQELIYNMNHKKILYKNDISPFFLDLLNNLLSIEPKNRFDYSDLLNHPWFFSKTIRKDYDYDDIFLMDDYDTSNLFSYSQIINSSNYLNYNSNLNDSNEELYDTNYYSIQSNSNTKPINIDSKVNLIENFYYKPNIDKCENQDISFNKNISDSFLNRSFKFIKTIVSSFNTP